ncbi:MAG: thiamine diphosphokinase [Acidimicrobiia bacterium]
METILVFTGGDAPPGGVLEDLPNPDLVVAADSGYDSARALGFAVDVIVGDMDSIATTEIPDHVIVERHSPEKDATDLELALKLAVRDHPARIVVVGGSGGRLDHEIGIAHLLCSPRWADVEEIDWIHARGRAHVIHQRRILHGDLGSTLSLLPVGGHATDVSTTGLKWNLDDETLSHDDTRGISNVMVSPVADIRVGRGCLLAVFPLA